MCAMEIHAHVPKPGNTVLHWLVEGLFIVISVLLAFGVAQFRESRAERELIQVLRHDRSDFGLDPPALGQQVISIQYRNPC